MGSQEDLMRTVQRFSAWPLLEVRIKCQNQPQITLILPLFIYGDLQTIANSIIILNCAIVYTNKCAAILQPSNEEIGRFLSEYSLF